jgi:hypothetical protein
MATRARRREAMPILILMEVRIEYGIFVTATVIAQIRGQREPVVEHLGHFGLGERKACRGSFLRMSCYPANS